ncbi:MAG TPA: hypothetical protein VNN77_12355 [candidate division Zixibacteria bacterium]|nr:hypothetical protein [candidate division Zixibacteria bacterium]
MLNEFVGDLVIASRAMGWLDARALQSKVSHEFKVTVHRMCIWHLVATLSKWQEVYDCYHELFPKDVREASRELRKELERRGVRDFRNTVVGHILDKKTKKPMTKADIDKKLSKIFNGDYEGFLLGVNTPGGNDFPKTVVSIVEQIGDRLTQEHSITPEELFPWKHHDKVGV